MQDNLLTVVLITYNHKDTFRKAIESVLSQKTNFNFCIQVYDDCSTDGTSDIVREYAAKYPHKVIPFIREKNLKGKNTYDAIAHVTSKYFAVLETDDYWCDDEKLQLQIDALEKHPECSFCGHNTLFNCLINNKSEPYVHVKGNKILALAKKRICQKEYIEPHMSSRVYRTECLKLAEIKDPIIATYDVASNFYFLTKGKLYYIDRIMSVYNYSEKGSYSGASQYKQKFMTANVINRLNIEFDYKYNNLLSRFFSTRLNLNYFTYLGLKYFTPVSKLKDKYAKILKNYEKTYLQKVNIKPIFKISVPIGNKKYLSLELKREKELI